MQIQVSTDETIEGREALSTRVRGALEVALQRFSARITLLEAHLVEENGRERGAEDKRCTLEARLEGRRPAAVTHRAATVDEAVSGASDKLASLLDSAPRRARDAR